MTGVLDPTTNSVGAKKPVGLQVSSYADTHGDLVVRLDGDLDLATAGPLPEALRSQRETVAGECLLLDLSGITFLDSRGLSALLGLRQDAEDAGYRVRAVAMSAAVARVLDLVGITDLFAHGT